jgi:hypothetical protein
MRRMNALLIDAPVGRHFAQLHRDSEALAENVSLFIETGLRRGTSVVAIATTGHTEDFLERLGRSGLDAETFRRSGRLTLLNAEAMLGRFMHGGMPDWADFRKAIGAVLEGAQAFGESSIRAYGEMVNILWNDGHSQAAIRLEEYWNELSRLYPFSLFCGYMLDSQLKESYHGPLHEIGRTHSDVIATPEDELFREALDAASKDVFGVPLAQLLSLSGQEDNPGEHRLPGGQRTMLWIMRHLPSSSSKVLDLARHYYQQLRSPNS